ncbi:hypothetical protein RI367_004065 [Sorochytrium milnesiophthora]
MTRQDINSMLYTALYLLLVVSAVVLAQGDNSRSPTVSTWLGTIVGALCNDGTSSTTPYAHYKSIPYALPPTGQNRWMPPVPLTDSYTNGSFDATHEGPACIQGSFIGVPAPVVQSEDCLSLDVYAPAQIPQGAALPVRVFIHGGGYESGWAAFPPYNGCNAASDTDSIIVVPQYRVGAFGFMAHRAVGSGNYGLMDQQLALRWVQNNIASFGGDPKKVGIYGESAGGGSVVLQMIAVNATGLFNSVVAESQPVFHLQPLRVAQQFADVIGQKLNCTGDGAVVCLRSASAADILTASMFPPSPKLTDNLLYGIAGLAPVHDGTFIAQQPADACAQGAYANVSVLAGTNADEARLFVAPPAYIGFDNYTAYLAASVPPALIPNVSALYPAVPSVPITAYLAIVQMVTDRSFACPTRHFLRALRNASTPAYSYLFTQTLSCPYVPGVPPQALQAAHFAEIPLVFEHFSGLAPNSNCTLSPAEQILARQMNAAWTGMIASGSPSVANVVDWPQYPAYVNLNASGPTVVPDVDPLVGQWEVRCAIWDAVPVIWTVRGVPVDSAMTPDESHRHSTAKLSTGIGAAVLALLLTVAMYKKFM